jgi:hypothetical protein
MLTRIRPDKQIQRAAASGYVLVSDANGELQFQLLANLVSGGGGGITAVRDITDVSLLANNLVIKYLDAAGNEQVKTVSLAAFATDVKIDNATLIQRSEQGTYVLNIHQSDGTSIEIDLKSLLAVVTTNTADITLAGDGTPANPLRATLTQAVKDKLGAYKYTEEFTGLNNDSGKTIHLAHVPIPGTVKVYRNGMRQGSGDMYMTDRSDGQGDPTIISFYTFFGSGIQDTETVIVDYESAYDGLGGVAHG